LKLENTGSFGAAATSFASSDIVTPENQRTQTGQIHEGVKDLTLYLFYKIKNFRDLTRIRVKLLSRIPRVI
jgi:hypothetical protein